uniref:Probable intron-encoded endonuclease aI3 n=1 Tax=Dictyostelium citrinum TaxID=361072 RepID=AI3_DICCI|nr:endonuclease ai4 [Dictyostelium citrinum]Q2LCQ5.1 RecName: Full=Probable intron-encoded endonuclease aI3; AltName: Full=Cox1/2 intron3 ORF [Dictyostelium citrinum]ABC60388.1 endonuclease ai4 [Dictyostelium citrinum]
MKVEKRKIDTESIKKFWVGLLEGSGSIQVNHWKKKNLQFRLEIKLKNCNENFLMFKDIQKAIGGYIRFETSKKKERDQVVWIVDQKTEIERIIKIFDQYALLTKQKQDQLNFLKENLQRQDVNWYLKERDNKYKVRVAHPDYKIKDITYFNEWLSGFVEAEGCFCIRTSTYHSFSISQKYEKVLLSQIKEFFNITTQIKESKKNIFLLEVYKKVILQKLIHHFIEYPLLGEKNKSFERFKNFF